MSNISTLVGLYNNLDYTKHFYETFRNIYPTEELVFMSYGSTDGTHEWLQDLLSFDKNVIGFFTHEKKTFSDTYNKAIELSSKSFCCFAHNDMVVAPGFLENLEKYTHKDRVISYTTIEPPIFGDHSRPGKIIQNLGENIIDFRVNDFYSFCKGTKLKFENQTEDGISFFMCLSRDVLLEIGGFDNIFNPYFSEDDDLIRRLKLKNLKCFTSLDSIVYHFVSKTSRFSEEAKSKTAEIETNSNRTYLRKWGSYNSNHRYNVGFIVENCDYNILHHLEPWCDIIYYGNPNDPMGYIKSEYINKNQPQTTWDLGEKIKYYKSEIKNDILISFDGSKLNSNNFEIIQNLHNILQDVSVGETYEIDIFTINVVRKIDYIQELIYLNKG